MLVVNLIQTMGGRRVVFLYVVCALLSFVVLCVEAEVLFEARCEDLGFTGLALCSDCDSLAEYAKDRELEADCQQCCAEESENALSKD